MSSYWQDPADQAGPPPGSHPGPPPGAPPGPPPSPPPIGQPWNQQGYPPGYSGYPAMAPGAPAPVSSAGRRFGAWLLDGLLVIVTLFIGWFIWSMVLWSRGQSPAKSLLGMRCIEVNTGRAATWGTMALRELVGKIVLGNITFGITTLVSGIMILTDDQRHEGIWDKIASTVVVDDPDGRLAP
jgi:uncharacterized RDD family membrane protein YckC